MVHDGAARASADGTAWPCTWVIRLRRTAGHLASSQTIKRDPGRSSAAVS